MEQWALQNHTASPEVGKAENDEKVKFKAMTGKDLNGCCLRQLQESVIATCAKRMIYKKSSITCIIHKAPLFIRQALARGSWLFQPNICRSQPSTRGQQLPLQAS